MRLPLPLGTKTLLGTIAAVAFITSERYYFILSKQGVVSMMPASTIEEMHTGRQK